MRLAHALAALALLLASCSRHEFSPLAAAARTGDVAAIRALSTRTALIEQPSGAHGWTPLMHAVNTNHPAAAHALLEIGADPNAASPKGVTALMMAASYGLDRMVALLLDHGADPSLRDHAGRTALDHARAGTYDIDRIVFGRPRAGSIKLLENAAPPGAK